MKSAKILTILVVALGLMVCWPKTASAAEPMSSAFTYQGHLYDNNDVANDFYDFQFKLYDSNNGPGQIGSDVNVPDIDVIDGYFTVELDFGSSVFDGNAVWLDIGVRPGDMNDPNDYTTLSPRQAVTPTPYSLQTRGIFVDDALNVGIGTTNPLLKLHIAEAGMAALAVHETDNDVAGILQADTDYVSLHSAFNHPIRFMINDIMRVFIDTNGNVGIGITNPGAKLEVAGQVKITGGSPGNGKVLTSDANGLGNWQSLAVDGDSDSSNELNTSLVLNGNNLELTDNGGTLTTSLSALNDGDWTIAGSDIYSTLVGNVGIGTTSPDAKLDIVGDVNVTGSVATSDAVIMATNTGSGDGVEGKSWGSSGCGVEGWALWSGPGANYGGYFRAEGNSGYGVYGYASNNGNYENYGGYFMAQGQSGIGAYGFVMGDNGRAIKGMAFDSGAVTNYGGYFTAKGASGRGVYGEATKTGAVENYGGYFTAAGDQGRAVYGEATGSDGIGVYGEATGGGKAGHFEGDVHVNGNVDIVTNSSTTSLEVTNSSSMLGWAVHGHSNNSIGIYGSSSGYYAVKGENINTGNIGTLGGNENGVYGTHAGSTNSGSLGSASAGVRGSSSNGYGVYGISSTGYAGFFQGNVHITGSLSKGSGSFKIDHPLDPENKYLQHSFVESPDMMNVYNGNVVLDKKGGALIKLPEYFEVLNVDFRYQLTCIGGFAPVYIAEEISNNHFKIAGGKADMKISWQVTGIRQDAFAKANRIVVEQAKSIEERGYYLYPAAYGFGEDKSITHLQNQRTGPVTQVARKAGKL